MVTVKDQFSHMVFANAQNNKPVKFWAPSSKLEENKEKTHLLYNLLCFQIPPKRLEAWSLKSEWELSSSFKKKLRYFFRGSRFSQCFILSPALHCSLPSTFLCYFFLIAILLCTVPLQGNVWQSHSKISGLFIALYKYFKKIKHRVSGIESNFMKMKEIVWWDVCFLLTQFHEQGLYRRTRWTNDEWSRKSQSMNACQESK